MIRGIFYIEAQSNRRDAVEKSLRGIVNQVKKDRKIKLKKEFFDKVTEEEKKYSSLVELELEFEDLRSYFSAAIKYGPSAIELLEPEELVIPAKDFILAVGDIIVIAKKFYSRYGIRFEFKGGKEEVGLSEDEIEKLLEEGAIRAKIVVEVREKSWKKALKKFLSAVGDTVSVNKVKSKTNLIGIEAFAPEPLALVDIAVKHTPVLVEIIEPDEITLTISDLQSIGVELAGVFFEASHIVIGK